jgi:serine/threonine-protein kinase
MTRVLAGTIFINGTDDESWPFDDEKVSTSRAIEGVSHRPLSLKGKFHSFMVVFITIFALTFTGIVGFFTPPVFAQPAPTQIFKNLATGFCLDSNSEGEVYTMGCNGGSYQKWINIGTPDTVIYEDLATGFCLDSNSEGEVYTMGCNGGSYQKWINIGTPDTVIYKDLATGFCLDSNSEGEVYTMECNGGSYQKWLKE